MGMHPSMGMQHPPRRKGGPCHVQSISPQQYLRNSPLNLAHSYRILQASSWEGFSPTSNSHNLTSKIQSMGIHKHETMIFGGNMRSLFVAKLWRRNCCYMGPFGSDNMFDKSRMIVQNKKGNNSKPLILSIHNHGDQ